MNRSPRRSRLRSVALAAAAAGALLVSLAGCSSSNDDAKEPAKDPGFALIKPGKLVVAFVDGNLPNLALAPDGSLEGLDGEWINEFAKENGLEVVPSPMEFSAQILAVQQGKADIGTSTYYTAERAEQVYYAYPLWRDTTGVYVRNDFSYTGPDSFTGKKVGTIRGWTFGPYMEKSLGADSVVYFDDIPQAYSALISGQIAGVVNGSGGAFEDAYLAYADQMSFHAFAAGDYGLPEELIANQSHNYVRCDNAALADAMNATMQRLQDSGEWAKIQEKYGVPATSDYTAPLDPPVQHCK